jgi:glyoxylase-like metal-dependent hydrolase (beta-lactamase superfamily II)
MVLSVFGRYENLKIGNYELIVIETGRFALDGGAMFGVVPKTLWQKANPADENNRIDLALRSLLLKSDDLLILVDTGIGNKFDDKFSERYKVDFSNYSINKSLEENRLSPSDITDVIITHLHFDHAGGTTYQDEGELKLTFPNAIHHVQGEQWDWAVGPSEKDKASYLRNDFSLLEKENKINKLPGPQELFPGVELLVMYGHTQGMQIVKISDADTTLLYCADLIPTSSHIPIPWVMAYDNNPLITMNEKSRLLPRAVDEKWILFFEHDPYRHAASVSLTDKGFRMKEEVTINFI